MSERPKIAIATLVILGSVVLTYGGFPQTMGPTVDGMPSSGASGLWPVWTGLSGLVIGTLLLCFWGRTVKAPISR